MASIGELTATVRADISGYVGPMRQVATTNQQVAASVASSGTNIAQIGQAMTVAGTQGANWSKVLERVEHVSTLVGVETLGLGTHFGRLASQLGPLIGAGGLFAAVAGGIALISAAYSKATEEVDKQKAAVADLVKEYDDATGATVRMRVELARLALAREQQGHLGLGSLFGAGSMLTGGVPLIIPTVDNAALTDATHALTQALKDLDDWTTQHHLPNEQRRQAALRQSAEATRALAAAMQELKTKAQESEHTDAKKFEAVTKEGQAWEALKRQIVAATLAQEANSAASREAAKALQGVKGDASVKNAVANATGGMRDIAQAAAQSFASAFGNALRGQSQDLLGSFYTVLRDAILGAIEKLAEQKIFDDLLKAISPNKTSGVSDALSIVGGVVGGFFGTPSVPMAGAMAGGGTVVVSGASIPPALSPVQHARDQQWQALLIESNRVAEANGARWRYQRM